MIAMPSKLRPLIAVVAAMGLIFLAWTGIPSALNQLPQENTLPQSIQVVAQLISGVFAIVVLLMAFIWRQKAWIAEVIFAASCALSASFATVVWGESSMLVGVASFVGAALIAGLLVWMLRVGVRDLGRVRS